MCTYTWNTEIFFLNLPFLERSLDCRENVYVYIQHLPVKIFFGKTKISFFLLNLYEFTFIKNTQKPIFFTAVYVLRVLFRLKEILSKFSLVYHTRFLFSLCVCGKSIVTFFILMSHRWCQKSKGREHAVLSLLKRERYR